MIERIVIAVLLGISILFMLLVLIRLLHESLRAKSRSEELQRTRLTMVDGPICSIAIPHLKRAPE